MNSTITSTEDRIIRVFSDDKTSWWSIEYIGIESDGSAKRKIIRLCPEEMDALIDVVRNKEKQA